MKIGVFTDTHYCNAEVMCKTRRPLLSPVKIREAMEAFRAVVASRPCTVDDPIIRSDNIKNTLVAAVKEANESV